MLSDPDVTRIFLGTGIEEYQLDFIDAVIDPGWDFKQGDTVTISAEIRFGSAIVDSSLETMLVFTSIRIGDVAVSCGDLAPGGGLAFASVRVNGSFGGSVARGTTATDSQLGSESQVCNAEDVEAPFPAFVFDGTQASYDFSFQLETTKDGMDTGEFSQLRFVGQSYVAPEPGPGVLVLLGLVGMAETSRRRRAQR